MNTGPVDAAALELALEGLDNTDDNVELFEVDQPFDADADPDLLFNVNVIGAVLDGVLNLDVLSDVLGGIGSVALTGLLDVAMTVDLSIAFGVDSTGFFIRTAGPVLPKLTITDLAISGETVGGGRFGFRGGFSDAWNHDYPRAEQHLALLLKDITYLDARTDGSRILTLDDPELFKYPIAYMWEPGFWVLNDVEALRFREYLLKGGFAIFDDFELVSYDPHPHIRAEVAV